MHQGKKERGQRRDERVKASVVCPAVDYLSAAFRRLLLMSSKSVSKQVENISIQHQYHHHPPTH
jgi:hypothetical protein